MKNIIMKNILPFGIFIFIIGLNACKSDDDTNAGPGITPSEEELITRVNLIFSDTLGTIIDTVSFNDPDGDGGNAPIIDTIKLHKDSIYKLSLEFKDASNPNDIEDITAEILEEDDEHLICFDQLNVSGLTIERKDTDGTYEVGLKSEWTIISSAVSNQGTVKLTLRHQPGAKDGTCTPGSTDVEIDFPLVLN